MKKTLMPATNQQQTMGNENLFSYFLNIALNFFLLSKEKRVQEMDYITI